MKLREGLRSLRYHAESDAIYEALVRARQTCKVVDRFRVVVYTVQSNHLHLIVESDSSDDLQTGMRGLMACLGNALRKLWGVRGGVFADRYHLEIIDTPTRMRNAFGYVLNNGRRHGCWTKNAPDPYSSGPWFHGWAEPLAGEAQPRGPSPCPEPRTWLATIGWRRAGPLISFAYTPRKVRRRFAPQNRRPVAEITVRRSEVTK